MQLSIETSPQQSDVEALAEGLNQYGLPTTGTAGFLPLAVFARGADGAVVGGTHGQVNWNWLFVSLFWVSPERRHAGLGSKILAALEAAARDRGCTNAHLDTFSFQARPFYERHGYSVFATLEDYPPGHRRFFMRKVLGPAGGA